MTFKNINSAINQELGRIAGVQHSYINRKYGKQQYNSVFDKPLEFPQWFLKGIRHFESLGYEFEFLTSELVRITVPGKTEKVLRTKADFKNEWESYKADFYL